MSNSEIIREENDYRVKLVLDEYPHEPEDDGQSPLLRIDRTRSFPTVKHVMTGSRPEGHDERIEEAAARWSGDERSLEKYLRAFHGATAFKWYGPNNYTDYTYVAYDTADWREYAGAPVDSAEMGEWIAYLEGEVYGWIVERKVREETITRELDGTEISRDETDAWEEVDSCWGYYGYEYAKEAAEEALNSYTKETVE